MDLHQGFYTCCLPSSKTCANRSLLLLYSTSMKWELTFCGGCILLEKDLLLWSWKYFLQADSREIVVYLVRHGQRNHYFRFWWLGCSGQGLAVRQVARHCIINFALHRDSWLSKAAKPLPRSSGLFWHELIQLDLFWMQLSCKWSQGQACSALLYQMWLNPAGSKRGMSPFPARDSAPALQLHSLSPVLEYTALNTLPLNTNWMCWP